ncbi:hypothetical protein D3C75_1006550 [compost metagenome]
MLGAQFARCRLQSILIAGDQQQIKTACRQTLGVNRTDTRRSTGDEGRTWGLNRIHGSAPEKRKEKTSACVSGRGVERQIDYMHNLFTI